MTDSSKVAPGLNAGGYPPSRTVDWFAVHQFVQALVEHPETLPVIGTLAWQQLATNDKTLACIAAAEHYALHLETRQAARAQTSKDIAASTDWTAVARGVQRRASGVYIPREVA